MSKTEKNKKSKNKNLRSILFFILLLSLGAVVGYGIGKMSLINAPHSPKSFYWVWIPLMIVVYFFTIAFHELGHVLGGLWVGFQFRMYVVGPFMWKKEAEQITFQWNKNLNIGGGLALCLPTDDHNLIKRFITFIVGGPLASLALSAFVLIPYILLGMHQPQTAFWSFTGSSFLVLLGVFSGIIFLITIIPSRAGGFYTDGARILNLAGGGNKAKLEVILLQTIAQGAAGIRPRELDKEQLIEALNLNTNSAFKMYIKGYLYQINLDQGNIEEAEQYLNAYYDELENIPGGYQASVILDKAFFEAYYKNNPEEAEKLYQSASIGAVIPKHQIFKTQTAIAFAKGEYEKAKELAQNTLKELSKHMDRGVATMEKEWLENILIAIDVS